MGAVSLHGCGFIFIQHAAGNVFLVNRSRPRAAARRGERLGSVSFPERTHGPEEGVPSTAARVAMEMRAEVYGRRAA